MYPVKLGIEEAKSRINTLIKNGHHAEALLTSIFTFEKTIHRTLKQLIISSGFINKDANKLLKRLQGFNSQKEIWSCFDPNGKTLPEIISSSQWQYIQPAIKMRNSLVHGSRTYNLDKCKEMTENILNLINDTINTFNDEYNYNGWKTIKVRRKSTLHSDPKVNIKNT